MKTNQNTNQQPDENRNQKSNGSGSKAQTVDQWWEKLPPAEREFAYELGQIVRAFRENDFGAIAGDSSKVEEAMRKMMEGAGAAFKNAEGKLRLASVRNGKGRGLTKETPDCWWMRMPLLQRMVLRQIAAMIEEVTESRRIEIRKVGAGIKVRFIRILRQPEKGCLSAIMLPEPSGRGWN